MQKYEVVFIVDPEKTDEQSVAVTEDTKTFIEKEGGTVDHVEPWGKKKLAYAVKKQRYGTYILIHFSAPNDLVVKLERHLKHNESVIKYLTLLYDARSALKPPSMEGASYFGREYLHGGRG